MPLDLHAGSGSWRSEKSSCRILEQLSRAREHYDQDAIDQLETSERYELSSLFAAHYSLFVPSESRMPTRDVFVPYGCGTSNESYCRAAALFGIITVEYPH